MWGENIYEISIIFKFFICLFIQIYIIHHKLVIKTKRDKSQKRIKDIISEKNKAKEHQIIFYW